MDNDVTEIVGIKYPGEYSMGRQYRAGIVRIGQMGHMMLVVTFYIS